MKRNEIIGILTILKATYPNFYKQMQEDEIEDIVSVWEMMFESDDCIVVTEAIKSLIVTHKFPPVIADVKEKIRLITAKPSTEMTETEAWNKVKSAISYYSAGENFDSLPLILQKLVGSSNQLREWSQMDSDTLNTVVQSNFMRSYKAKSENEKQYQALPESTKLMIGELSQKFKMLEG